MMTTHAFIMYSLYLKFQNFELVIGHLMIDNFSAGTIFRRNNLMSTDVVSKTVRQ